MWLAMHDVCPSPGVACVPATQAYFIAEVIRGPGSFASGWEALGEGGAFWLGLSVYVGDLKEASAS